MSPLISIIIPCYNHGQYIEDAIKSIEKFADKTIYEIIIINDGSTDNNTKDKLVALKNKGYNIIDQDNQGLSNTRNNGILASKGKYIITLDADDRLTSVYLQKGIEILDSNPDVGILYGNSTHFGDENRTFKPGSFSLKKLLVENYINSCIFMRKEVWLDVNGYDSNLSAYEDWDFNLSAVKAGWKLHYIEEIVFEYRILNNSMIRSRTNLQQCIDYIAQKHGTLYRIEFLKTITITDRLKSSVYDFYKKIIGKPNY